VSAEDILKCEEKYGKAKLVHSLLRNVSEKQNLPLEDLYTNIGWPLYKKYGHAYEGFKIAVTQQEEVFADIKPINDTVIPELLSQISRRLTPQPTKLRADLEITCFAEAGIDAIKNGIRAGEKLANDNAPLKIKLVAPPLYVMVAYTLEKVLGIAQMEKSLGAIEAEMKKQGGDLVVKMKPTAVSETDDVELMKLMERMVCILFCVETSFY